MEAFFIEDIRASANKRKIITGLKPPRSGRCANFLNYIC